MQIDEAQELRFVYDFGQVYLYDSDVEPEGDVYLEALEDAKRQGRGVGVSGLLVDLLMPSQYNFEAPLEIELHDAEPERDLDDWDQVSEFPLALPSGKLILEASGGTGLQQAELVAGRYRARWSGDAYSGAEPYGPAGEEAQEDHYRLQLWPASDEEVLDLKTWPAFSDQA